jgi:hypothetical protein
MRKFLWIAIALIVIVGLAVGVIHRARRVQVTTDVAKLEADLREHLPAGSSRAEVASFLDQRGIPHSYVDDSKGAPEYGRAGGAETMGLTLCSWVCSWGCRTLRF